MQAVLHDALTSCGGDVLQLLDLSGCHNISAYGFIQVATLTNLKHLFIHDVDITRRIEGTLAEHELQASDVQSLFVSLPGEFVVHLFGGRGGGGGGMEPLLALLNPLASQAPL
jgi:hypothetical protein